MISFNPCFYGSVSGIREFRRRHVWVDGVSILVFMEVFLEWAVPPAVKGLAECFNPCFYGSVSGI